MKKAFTLIEILIVISIILIITSIGIGSYTMVRKNMTVDLETDKLVAVMHSLRETSRTEVKCAGLKLTKNSPPEKIEALYKNAVDGCDETETLSEIDWSNEIIISEIALDGIKHNVASVIFVPPMGNMQLKPTASKSDITLALKNGNYKTKTISLDKLTGKIEKL